LNPGHCGYEFEPRESDNAYNGMTNIELRGKIDKIGDLIYEELVDKVGKENVVIEHKEVEHRIIFF
jgi:hypothetical protein